jgi:hypothetical protein
MGLDVSAIVTEFGALYGTRRKEIYTEIMKDNNLEKYMSHIPNVSGSYEMAMAMVDEITQPFQQAWTPKGGVTFIPNKIDVARVKFDVEFYVDQIVQGWLGFLAQEGKSRTEWPITKYMVKLLTDKAKEERGVIAVQGAKSAPTPGTAGAMLTAFDGIQTILDAAEAEDNGINLVDIGDLSVADEKYPKVKLFMRSFTQAELRAFGKVIFCSTELVSAIADELEDKDKYHINTEKLWLTGDDYGIVLPNSGGVKLIGIENMTDHERLFATPKSNFLKIYDQISEFGQFEVEKAKRQLHVMSDYMVAFGFGFNQLVWTNKKDVEEEEE